MVFKISGSVQGVHIKRASTKISCKAKLNLSYVLHHPAVSVLKTPGQGNLSNNFAGQCNL